MITLKLLADNFYNLFKNAKPAPRVRHLRTLTWGDDITLQGTATGTKLYTMEIALRKDEGGKVDYTSPVSYIKCSCPAFQYFVQDPLHKIGSTAPGTGHVNMKINNPQQIAAPCKHLYAYIQHIMQKGLLSAANMRVAKKEIGR